MSEKLEISESVSNEIEALKEQFKDGFSLRDIKYMAARLVYFIEIIGLFGSKAGEQKRMFVIKTIDDLIKLPALLEWLDNLLLKLLINWIVDKFKEKEWAKSAVDFFK